MPTTPSYYGSFSFRDMPTYNSVADYIADARILLQDTIPPYRYDDPSLLTALNVTMLDTLRLRADLFVYDLEVRGQAQAFQAVDDTYVKIEPPFRPSIVNGICGHALKRDQEDVQDVRATAFMTMFYNGLVGRGPPTGIAGGSGPGQDQRGPQ